jgi:two-component system OmpR family response regulator
LLIVSPDRSLLAVAQQHAQALGHSALLAESAADARRYLVRGRVDLICLDSLVASEEAERLLRLARAGGDGGPAVLLFVPPAASSPIPDFLRREPGTTVSKPIVGEELARELTEALARAEAREGDRLTRAGPATLDGVTHQLSFGGAGRPIHLPPTEFRLLRCLMQQAGDFVATPEILRQVWGYAGDDLGGSEVIRAHVSNLRRKLRLAGEDPHLLRTLPHRGYGFGLPEPGGAYSRWPLPSTSSSKSSSSNSSE